MIYYHDHFSQANLNIQYKYHLEKLLAPPSLDFVKEPNIIGLRMILLLAGDVSLNPGPVRRFNTLGLINCRSLKKNNIVQDMNQLRLWILTYRI